MCLFFFSRQHLFRKLVGKQWRGRRAPGSDNIFFFSKEAEVLQIHHKEEQISGGLLTVAQFPACHPQERGRSSERVKLVLELHLRSREDDQPAGVFNLNHGC